MATLLLAEVAGGGLSDMTARALTAALEIGQPVDVLVAGHNVGAAAEAAAKLAGVTKVRVADDAALRACAGRADRRADRLARSGLRRDRRAVDREREEHRRRARRRCST